MRKAIILLAGALLFGSAAVAFASIPDANGVIHGCRKNSDSSLKVIDSDLGQTCANGYTVLNWEAGPRSRTPYGLHIVSSVVTITDDGLIQSPYVACPIGEVAIDQEAVLADGTGADLQDIHPEKPAANKTPSDSQNPTGYNFYVRGGASGTGNDSLFVYLTCGKYS